MKIALMMLCHTLPEQINSFISWFDEENFDIYLHVDSKSNIQSMIKNQSNVYFVPNERRIDVRWGTFSMVQATLELIELVSRIGVYDYCWLCSGQDFPIKSSKKIVDFMNHKKNTNFISFVSSENYPKTGGEKTQFDKRCAIIYPSWIIGKSFIQRGVKKAYVTLTGGTKNTFKMFERKLPGGLSPFFGSQWWCLNWQTISWIREYIAQHEEVCEFYKRTLCPDESFFQTLVMNSPYSQIIEPNLVYLVWENNQSSPKTFADGDYDLLMASDKLFARKMDCRIAPELYNRLLSRNTYPDN